MINSREPDNVITLDLSKVPNLQIGYHCESIYLYESEDDTFVLKEYIGETAYEYLVKVNSNRFKTSIRYGRREQVNTDNFVEIFMPKSYKGELELSTQYGHIRTDCNWEFSRFAAATNDGNIVLKAINAPRIRLQTSVGTVEVERAIGFTDIRTMSGAINVGCIDGGACLVTSSAPIHATFNSMDNSVECNTPNSDIDIAVPENTGLKFEGVTKTGSIVTDIEGLEVKVKPGNINAIQGTLGEKPFQNVKLNSINGNIKVSYKA